MNLQMKMMEICEEGSEEGEAKGKAEVVMKMLLGNEPVSRIMEYTDATAEQIFTDFCNFSVT